MTERAHGGAEYGDRHRIRTTGLFTWWTCPSPGRTVQATCNAQIWGQARCPVYRSGTFNVQRSTLNFQWGDRKGAWWPGYGDRHAIWAAGLLTRWTRGSAGRTVQAGWGTQIWGQTQNLTRNFKRGDRKGACWAGYGDRHEILTTGLLTRGTDPSAGLAVQAGGAPRYGDRHGVATTPITGFCLSAVASPSAVPVFFSGGVSRGQGTKSKQIFPSPAAQSFLINGHKHCVFGRGTSLVPATPGWEICRLWSVIPGLYPKLSFIAAAQHYSCFFPRELPFDRPCACGKKFLVRVHGLMLLHSALSGLVLFPKPAHSDFEFGQFFI